jgi:hypothetical protein
MLSSSLSGYLSFGSVSALSPFHVEQSLDLFRSFNGQLFVQISNLLNYAHVSSDVAKSRMQEIPIMSAYGAESSSSLVPSPQLKSMQLIQDDTATAKYREAAVRELEDYQLQEF